MLEPTKVMNDTNYRPRLRNDSDRRVWESFGNLLNPTSNSLPEVVRIPRRSTGARNASSPVESYTGTTSPTHDKFILDKCVRYTSLVNKEQTELANSVLQKHKRQNHKLKLMNWINYDLVVLQCQRNQGLAWSNSRRPRRQPAETLSRLTSFSPFRENQVQTTSTKLEPASSVSASVPSSTLSSTSSASSTAATGVPTNECCTTC